MASNGEPQPVPEDRPAPAIRASDQDRDAIVQRLQQAFAERPPHGDRFDEGMRAALTARTGADLDKLTADLPAAMPGSTPDGPVPASTGPAAPARRSGRWAIAYKS